MWIAVFTFVTLGVGVKTFWVLDAQLNEMRSSSEDGHKTLIATNAHLADAARIQADAATRLAAAAEAANRPWIAIASADIQGPWQLDTATNIKLNYLNTGRAVAASVQCGADSSPYDVGKPSNSGSHRLVQDRI